MVVKIGTLILKMYRAIIACCNQIPEKASYVHIFYVLIKFKNVV